MAFSDRLRRLSGGRSSGIDLDAPALWNQVLSWLSTTLDGPAYRSWFGSASAGELTHTTFTINVRDDLAIRVIEREYLEQIQRFASKAVGRKLKITLDVPVTPEVTRLMQEHGLDRETAMSSERRKKRENRDKKRIEDDKKRIEDDVIAMIGPRTSGVIVDQHIRRAIAEYVRASAADRGVAGSRAGGSDRFRDLHIRLGAMRTIASKSSRDTDQVRREHALAALGVGDYAVKLESVEAPGADDDPCLGDKWFVELVLENFLGYPYPEYEEVATRVEHIGPQEIASGISLAGAVELQELFTDMGIRARVTEGRPKAAGGSRKRESIREAVRHEVWRRDDGECVDCGSRERLEFDHIIPVSEGGANTVRNLELRCESCNRSKGAKI